MKIIGITGGVGSGKSRVLSFLEEHYHAVICQADHVAWELQCPGQECHRQIVETFGQHIINEDGTINRGKLGEIVFADKGELLKLNAIMHPSVKIRIKERINEEKAKGASLFVLEAALLLEDDYDEICDELWYIYTDETVRRMRLKASRDYSEEKTSAIMASQISGEIYRNGCQIMIDNSGTFEETARQIEEILK